MVQMCLCHVNDSSVALTVPPATSLNHRLKATVSVVVVSANFLSVFQLAIASFLSTSPRRSSSRQSKRKILAILVTSR